MGTKKYGTGGDGMKQMRAKKIWALFLSAAVAVTQLPAVAMAGEPGDIVSFAPLDKSVAKQTVPLGTDLSELNLPEEVKVKVRQIVEETVPPDDDSEKEEKPEQPASPGEAQREPSERKRGEESGGRTVEKTVTIWKMMPVTWDSRPDYDSDTAGVYIFTADLEESAAPDNVKPPQITVTVGEEGGENNPEDGQTDKPGLEGEPGPEDANLFKGELPEIGFYMLNDRFTVDKLVYKVVGADEAQVVNHVDYENASGQLTIPALVTNPLDNRQYEVVSIGNGAFEDCENLTGKLVIPKSVTEIGDAAFSGCTGFSGTLKLPDGLAEIGEAAFLGCDGFSALELPDSVTSVGAAAFRLCTGFRGTLKLPNGLETIGESAFYNCNGFTGSLKLPEGLNEIGDSAFRLCSGFDGNLILPDSLTEIGKSAFSGCKGFKGDLDLPDNLEMIQNSAFRECSGFDGRLKLPSNLKLIGTTAFYKCDSLSGTLELPDGLVEIRTDAFRACSGFSGDLILPDSLVKIGSIAFYQCGGFNGTLKLPAYVTEIGEHAFSECSGFTGEVVVPDTVTEIGGAAFHNVMISKYICGTERVARLLESSGISSDDIELNEAVLPQGDFFDYGDLQYIVIDDSNHVSVREYRHFSTPGQDLVIPPTVIGRGGKEYTVTAIFDKAFKDSTISGSITLPETLREIGDSAFENASYTGELKLPSGLEKIGKSAFAGCSGLEGSLELPGNLTKIGESAFAGCSGFDGTLKLQGSLEEIGSSAFAGCDGFYGDLELPSGLRKIGESAFAGCSGFKGSLQLPSSLEEIGNSAFKNCGFTGELALPEHLAEIGQSTFSNCSGFTGTLKIPSGLTGIGESAFTRCSGFTGLELPSSLNEIGAYAFAQCKSLSGILMIPDGVARIGRAAFSGCAGLESAHFGKGLEYLGDSVFPDKLPLSTDSPRVQLIINKYLNLETLPSAVWDGTEGVPGGAIAAVNQDVTVGGTRHIAAGADVTVTPGAVLTVDGTLVIDGTLTIEGSLIINGAVSGSGTLYVVSKAVAEGDTSGVNTVIFEDDIVIAQAANVIQNHRYVFSKAEAGDAAALENLLKKELAGLAALQAAGAAVGEIRILTMVPAKDGTSASPDGTEGNFTFTVQLTMGSRTGMATAHGTITAGSRYAQKSSSGRDSSYNTDILRGTWERMETGTWRFRQMSGAYAKSRWGLIDGLWYLFDAEGRMLTNWQYTGEKWYYLATEEYAKTNPGKKEGQMITGWYYDPAYQGWFYLGDDGAMVTGWKEIEGKWHYFSPVWDGRRGMMLLNTVIDGWIIGEDGVGRENQP